jgi:O-antigen/teichoic acid export membrane protein
MGFFYWFIAGKALLPKEYGIIATSTNLAMLLSRISLIGLDTATWKLISEYVAKKREAEINSFIRFSFIVTLFTNLTLALFLISLSGPLEPILKIPTPVIWLTAAILLVLSFSRQSGLIIYSFQNMRKFLTTDLFGQLAKVLVSAILIFLGFRYIGPLIGFLFGFILIASWRLLSLPRGGKVGQIDRRETMLNYALPALITALAWIVFSSAQQVLLTVLKGPEATGIFSIAMFLTRPVIVMPNILTQALLPITSRLSVSHNSKKKQSYLIELIFRYALFISLPAALFLILFSSPTILIFSRLEYLPAAQLFPILAVAAIIYGLGNTLLHNLYAIGKIKTNRNIVIVTTVSFLLMAVPLILLLSGLGLAIAYGLAVSLLALLSFLCMRKYLELTLPWKNLAKPLIASSASFGFLYLTTSLTSGLAVGLALAGVAGLIYLAVLVPMRFYTPEDVKILEFVSHRSPLFKRQLSSLAKFLSNYV